jgi:hypothetical protein
MTTPSRPRSRPRQTQRVRVKLLINSQGEWVAYGWSGAGDDDPDGVLYDMMSDKDTDYAHTVFLTAEVPLPARAEFEVRAQVESGRGKGGLARATSLSPERRSEIAKLGAEARWKRKNSLQIHQVKGADNE